MSELSYAERRRDDHLYANGNENKAEGDKISLPEDMIPYDKQFDGYDGLIGFIPDRADSTPTITGESKKTPESIMTDLVSQLIQARLEEDPPKVKALERAIEYHGERYHLPYNKL